MSTTIVPDIELDVKDTEEVNPLIHPDHLKKSIRSHDEIVAQKKKVQQFYRSQNERIHGYLSMHKHQYEQRDGYRPTVQPHSRQVRKVVQLSFSLNILLFLLKITAAVASLSLAIIASTVDSFLDLLSGAILFFTERAGKRSNWDPYKYPQGKSRLEPIGIIIFCAAMGMAALQLLNESIQLIVEGISSGEYDVNMDAISISAFSVTLTIKFGLYMYSRWVLQNNPDSSIVEALMQDHRNDLYTNSLGFVCAMLAAEDSSLWFFDPVAAIILSLFIFVTWVNTALEQVGNLIGRSAPPEFIGRLTYLAASHDRRITRVDKVLAYHFGIRYLCEIDIVLPPELPLKIAHDIGESLEIQIEALEEVERAFVHLDFESTHKPEHKIPG